MCNKDQYIIRNNLPEPIVGVQEEEITILLPHLMKRILAAIEDAGSDRKDESSTIHKGQHR
jgi:hypothetical protein